ncbi:MAG: hypothetical protein HFJ53_05075 [Clostridia bacterium]|jgi:hypothetical protein|nr:hypothetical protein [Clostridia bacterium]
MYYYVDNNKKFIIIGISFILVIILIYFLFFSKISFLKKKYVVLTSTDNKYSIEIPSKIDYIVSENSEFTLDLYSSEDELYIYGSSILKKDDIEFYSIVDNDKSNYLSDKENVRDLSDIVELSIDDNKSYEYSFIYYDTSYEKDFYTNILWIENGDYIFVINFEVEAKNLDKYANILKDVKNRIKIFKDV